MQITFYMDKRLDRATISAKETPVKIATYNLHTEVFAPSDDHLTMYGYNDAALVAFVVISGRNRLREITQALRWYSKNVLQAEMEVTTIDPRPRPILRVVR